MKKIKLLSILALAAFAFSSFPLQAAQLHTILVADSTDDILGTAFANAVEKMHEKTSVIAMETGLSLSEHLLMGEDVRIANMANTFNSLNVQPDDVVIFYAAIHGYRNPDKKNPWPSLYLNLERQGVDFNFLNDLILAKNPRFFLSIADSCNETLPFNIPTYHKGGRIVRQENRSQENYKRLFLDTSGSIIISSAQPGEFSWAYVGIGGIWTLEFLNILDRAIYSSSHLDWNAILQTTNQNVIQTRIRQKGAMQNAQYLINITQ